MLERPKVRGKATVVVSLVVLVLAAISTLQNVTDLSRYQGSPISEGIHSIKNDTNLNATIQRETTKELTPPGQEPSKGTLSTPSNHSHWPTEPPTATSIACDPSPNQPLVKGISFPQYENASAYFSRDFPGDKNMMFPTHSFVMCRVHPVGKSHFPHVMQQLYGCYSYWQENLHDKSQLEKIPILQVPANMRGKLERNPFLTGFLQVMTKQLGVKVIVDDGRNQAEAIMEIYCNTTTTKSNQTFNPTTANFTFVPQDFDLSGGYILSHAKELNELVRELFYPSMTSMAFRETNDNICASNHAMSNENVGPRIGILNRKAFNGRFFSNAEDLEHSLRSVISSKNQSVSSSIQIYYFEDRSFQEQVEFFQGNDIILSPHGAQLTGVPFLANKACSQLLELFPKRYWIPSFFGSLARNAGVQYSYLYLSDNPPEGEQATSLRERVHARAQSLCPNPQEIVSVVLQLVNDWRQCCNTLKP
ncbi:DUF563 domain containing protein [Nitzschia inconspicua]|uniref:DUF563 domain containing protein n=1 Tax=Nitzschia inconspicua TaxID=303405 RepID=A0A9K3LXV1_9STRA|nr:DUF563 domain containing protein [Nitzschia inconspicua]